MSEILKSGCGLISVLSIYHALGVCRQHGVAFSMRCIQVLRSPNFFSGMEAGRNVQVIGEDVAVL
jgi:hypothetical protein